MLNGSSFTFCNGFYFSLLKEIGVHDRLADFELLHENFVFVDGCFIDGGLEEGLFGARDHLEIDMLGLRRETQFDGLAYLDWFFQFFVILFLYLL